MGISRAWLGAAVLALGAAALASSSSASRDESGIALPDETLGYVSNSGGIELVDGAGRHRRALPGTTRAIDLEWSPDGRSLAFTAVTVDGGNPYSDVWTISATGRNRRRLTHGGGSCCPFWSPDGTLIYYGGGKTTWQMRPDGSDQHPIAKHHPPVGGWSPDASLEAWSAEDAHDRYQLYVENADGTHLRQLTHNTATFLGGSVSFSSPSWSPDGTELVFFRRTDRRSDLDIVGVDGRGLRRIFAHTSPAPADASPSWSPDGRAIAFTRIIGNGEDVFLIRPDGTGLTRLTRGAQAFGVEWKPQSP